MPYKIHNFAYKMTDAVKGNRTQKHHMIKKNIKEIKKKFSRGKKKYPPKMGWLYMKMDLKSKD